MTRVAFLGFPQGIEQHASRIAATLNESYPDTVNLFTDIRSATQFVVTKDPATNQLSGIGNHIYIFSGHAPAEISMAQQKLAGPRVGLQIHLLSNFEDGRTEEDIRHWLANGEWPAIPVAVEATTDDLLDDLFTDGDFDVLEAEPVLVSATASVSGHESQTGVRPPNASGVVSYEPEADELNNSAQADDDIPLPFVRVPEPEQNEYADPNAYVPPVIESFVPEQFASPVYSGNEYVGDPLTVAQQNFVENPVANTFVSDDEDAPLPSQLASADTWTNQVETDDDEDAPLPSAQSFIAPVTQNLYQAPVVESVQHNVPASVDTESHALEASHKPEQGPNFDDILGGVAPISSPVVSAPATIPRTPSVAPSAPQQIAPVVAPVPTFQSPPVAPQPTMFAAPPVIHVQAAQPAYVAPAELAPIVPVDLPVIQPIASTPLPTMFSRQQSIPEPIVVAAPVAIEPPLFPQAALPIENDPYRANRYDSAPYLRDGQAPIPAYQEPGNYQTSYEEPTTEFVREDFNAQSDYVQGQSDYDPRQNDMTQQQYFQQPTAELAPLSVSPDQVRQASPDVVRESFIQAPEVAVQMPVRIEQPEPEREVYEYLEPEAQKSQGILEDQLQSFAQTTTNADQLSGTKGEILYITGSHGGVGKTTVAYMMANVAARALAQEPDNKREVWLIEADYRNSKLAQRLNVEAGNDSGRMASFLQDLNKRQGATIAGLPAIRAGVINDCVIKLPSSLHVVTCPYDSTKRDTRFIQMAIQQIVEYAKSRGAYVFVDADTLSSDDVLDRKLASMADKIVMVTDSGHISDVQRAANTLVKPVHQGGIGVQLARINIFLNRTGHQSFTDIVARGDLNPLSVTGFIPSISEWDTNWVGDQERGQNFANAVAKFAIFLNTVSPIPALKKWESHKLITKKARRSWFSRKPRV